MFNRKKISMLAAIAALFGAVNLTAEEISIPNPSFEMGVDKNGVAMKWEKKVERGLPNVDIDETTAHSGKCSLKFDRVDRDLIYYRQLLLPVENLQPGAKAEFSFWVKAENLTDGKHFSGFISFNGANRKELKRVLLHLEDGTYDWKQVKSSDIEIPADTKFISIYLSASWIFGTFWIDDVVLTQ